MLNKNTRTLLQDMYRLVHVQAALGEQDMSLDIDWVALRLRIEGVLVREGLEVPERLDIQQIEQEERDD